MILLLTHWLREYAHFQVPAVFGYSSTRMVMAAVTSLLITIFLGPHFIRILYAMKIGQSIRKEECPLLGQLHEKKQNTPTMGGILILFAMGVSLLLWMNLTHPFTLLLAMTTLILGGVGAWDDLLKLKYRNAKGISARTKLACQLGLSCLVMAYFLLPPFSEWVAQYTWFQMPTIREYGVAGEGSGPGVDLSNFASRLYIPFFKEPLIWGGGGLFLALILALFVIAGASNAVNLTDGLDGLAAGCLVIVAGAFGIIAFVSNHLVLARYLHIPYIEGSGEIAVYLSAMMGACLGFLWYNSYPAQVFMGDTGSLALGGILGVSAVMLKRELLLGIVGGIFVAEALSVLLQVASFRWRNKRRIFLCTPLHHHFEYKGWAEPKIVIRFWIVGLLLALIGIASLKFQ